MPSELFLIFFDFVGRCSECGATITAKNILMSRTDKVDKDTGQPIYVVLGEIEDPKNFWVGNPLKCKECGQQLLITAHSELPFNVTTDFEALRKGK